MGIFLCGLILLVFRLDKGGEGLAEQELFPHIRRHYLFWIRSAVFLILIDISGLQLMVESLYLLIHLRVDT